MAKRLSTDKLPGLRRDPAQAREDIAEHGVCFVADVLPSKVFKHVHEALYRVAADDRERGRVVKFGGDKQGDNTNQRVWNLLSRDPVFIDLATNDTALSFVRELLGWPALLSNISANITGPGGGEMSLHADQGFTGSPWGDQIRGVNVAWCVDDFTDANGATRIVPASHKMGRSPTAEEQSLETVPLEAPAGTMIVMEGRVWHRTGFNRTASEHRAGIFAFYTTGIYRPQENWFLSLDPTVRQFGSETLLQLLAYKSVGFGLVNGTSPQ